MLLLRRDGSTLAPFSDWTNPARPGSGARKANSRSIRNRISYPPELVFFDDLEVWVTRKNVKNLSLGVKPPDGRIEITAPLAIPDFQIEQFVFEKHDWIVRKQEEIVSSPMSLAANADKAEVEMWRRVVKAYVPDLIRKWETILGVKAGAIAYRNMKSRWGSCQPSTGRICINVRLALYPPECLEYVVVHELCHLRVDGHGPAFWTLVEHCLPNYKSAKAKLK